MSTSSFAGAERRNLTNQMINELVKGRQQVWSLYCTAAGLEPFTNNESVGDKVKEFCQIMVDYISLGHFGIYQRIVDGKERRSKVIKVAETIYPRIAQTTDLAVAFNDKYTKLSDEQLVESLSEDLSRLGEQLATRIELEDELIEAIIN